MPASPQPTQHPASQPAPHPPLGVITRFAPSPTGHLHIGGVRTALFCWAYARKLGGHFTLRVEDTDQARSSESSARGILEDLAWCGILWDEGPSFTTHDGRAIGGDPRRCVGSYYQSQRLELYNRVIDDMIARDLAYPAFDTQPEMDAMRKAAAERKETFRYKRAANYDRAAALARMKSERDEGRGAGGCVIRFNNPGNIVHVSDEVLGEIKFEPEHTDDFVIRKADGFPTYHFAVVVDDEQMGVTHVLRGQEHLNNTPRHVALQKALGYRTPVYAHLPLIFNPDASKMSKRDKDKAAREACKKAGITTAAQAFGEVLAGNASVSEADFKQWLDDKQRQLPSDALRALAKRVKITLPEIDVDDFRRAGYLPEVLCNYMALLGWNPGMKNPDGTDLERFGMDFLAQHFTIDRIGKTNSKFDRVKLASFNQSTLAALTIEQFAERFRVWAAAHEPALLASLSDQQVRWMCEAGKGRVKVLSEVVSPAGPNAFALLPDDGVVFDAAAADKALNKPIEPGSSTTGRDLLRSFAQELANVEPFHPEGIEAAVKVFVERHCPGKMGAIAQPLRVAIAGAAVSPPLGLTLGILGRASTLNRIERCLASA